MCYPPNVPSGTDSWHIGVCYTPGVPNGTHPINRARPARDARWVTQSPYPLLSKYLYAGKPNHHDHIFKRRTGPL
jgi:hypothetical protein